MQAIYGFSNKLNKLSRVIPQKTTIPGLECVLIQDGKLYATNQEQSVTIDITAETNDTTFAALIPFAEFNKIVQGVEVFTIELNGYDATIKIGRAKYTIKTLPIEHCIQSNIIPPDNFYKLPVKIHEYANFTNFASTDEFRPAMMNVCFDFPEKQVAATDSFTLNLRKFTQETEIPKILTSKDLLQICSNFPELDEIAIDGNQIYLRGGGVEISSKYCKDNYPPYGAVIPINNPYNVKFVKAEMLAVLKRLQVTMNLISKHVNFIFEGSEISVLSKDDEAGKCGVEIVNCTTDFTDRLEFSFSLPYFERCLQVMTEPFTLKLGEPNRPVIFANEQQTALIMPVRIS